MTAPATEDREMNTELQRNMDDVRLEITKLRSEQRLYERRLKQVNAALKALLDEQDDLQGQQIAESMRAYQAASDPTA